MPHARHPASAQKGRCVGGEDHLLAAGRAQESDARMGDHPSSPSSSASRRAATSSIENTRSPQTSFSRAMMSGLGADRAVDAAGNEVSWAKGRPRFRICTVSPCSIQDATFLNRWRKSVTDAVFTGDAKYHEAMAWQGFERRVEFHAVADCPRSRLASNPGTAPVPGRIVHPSRRDDSL